MQDNRSAPAASAAPPSGGDGGAAPPLHREADAASVSAAPAQDNTGPQPDAKKSPGRFTDSWRDDLAGPDKAFRKTLDRFDSPAALAKAYRELTARLSSGDLKATKPPPGD